MNEPESSPNKTARDKLLKWFGGIHVVADTQVPEVDVSDNRALEGEDDLQITGQTWLKQELKHTKHLHWVRLFLLGALFILVVLWLLSVVILLLMEGFHVWTFDLSDKVIIAYMTSTTVSVLGLFHIAAKWLFSASFADVSRSIKELYRKPS
ncbi:MAG TPA: hypothetical protein VJT71_16665 [Pyrinomonadaceae bacterium]|nr:hypothetical protein [Pyrinomonadaceae bacterium]